MGTIVLKGEKIPSLSMEEHQVIVTPELATALLMRNNDNIRKISRKRVRKIAEAMKKGKWVNDSGDLIVINSKGLIKDGQHRLMACMKSGKTFRAHFVYSDSDGNIDYHKKTKFSDLIKFKGYTHAIPFSTAARMIFRHGRGGAGYAFDSSNENADNWEIYRFISKEGRDTKLMKALKFAIPYAKPNVLNISLPSLSALVYLMRGKKKKQADEFFNILAKPSRTYGKMNIGTNDPIRSLKKFLESDFRKAPSEKASLSNKVARIIKTWNCWRTGKMVKSVTWKCTGENPEQFPEIK